MKISKLFNQSFYIMLIAVSLCCMILVIISMLFLPEIPIGNNEDSSKFEVKFTKDENLGIFGEMMVEMLPNDLAFTVFLPSDKAFERDLRLRVNHSFTPQEWDNVYATVSHVLGFSTIPRKVYADLIPVGKQLAYESISGFGLYVSKDYNDGVLVVNRIKAKRGFIKKGEVVVYVMDGVLMDAEFEESVQVDDIGGEEDAMQ